VSELTPTVLAMFLASAAFICVVAGLSLLFPESFLTVLWTGQPEKRAAMLAAAPWSALGLLALAPVLATAAWGCFQRQFWGWILAMSIIVLQGAVDLSRIFGGAALQGLFGVLVVWVVLFWLTRPKVKALFRS
jgi:hypothetical protein